MSVKYTFSTAFALVLAVPSIFAQESASSTLTLPEVVVTAPDISEQRSITVPSLEQARAAIETQAGAAEVIDAEEYKRGRSTTLKDALDFAPGVLIQSRFGAEESRLSIRGSGIQRTFHGRGLKLLQDGVPLNLADGGFDFQAIEPLATRYIEVYRGANALEFGGTTLGGAINFVSYTGYDAPPLDIRFEYGSFDTFRAQISSGQVIGPFDYYISLSEFSTDGYREHSRQSNQRLFANFGYRINPNLETRFFVTYALTDSQLPGELTKEQLEENPRQASRVPESLRRFQPVARFDYITSDWHRDYSLLRVANRTTWEDGDQKLTIGSYWSQKDLNHPILFVIDQYSNDFGADIRYDNSSDLFGHKNHFTLGLAPVYGVVEDNRYANNFGARGAKIGDAHQSSANVDLYLQERFYLLPTLAVVAGAQISYANRDSNDELTAPGNVDNSGSEDYWGYSPKFGFLWEITPKAQAFINVSRSFEPPSFGELGNAANNGLGLVQLDAQTATTLEIGTRGRQGRFSWDLAYYYAWLDDELLEFQVQPGLTQTANAGRTIHQGVEAALDIDLFKGIFTHESASAPASDGKSVSVAPPTPPQDRLVLRQTYLWNDFHFDNDPTFGSNQLPGVPGQYYRAELLYEHPCGFYAGPNVEWVPIKYNVDSVSTAYVDPYALLGFKIGYRRDHGFSVYFEAKNLTDKKYASTASVVGTYTGQSLFFPGDGRGFYAGIEWKW